MACNGPARPAVTAQDDPRAVEEASGADLALLAAEARRLGVDLDLRQLEQFSRYRAAILQWNQRVNLTAITDPAAVMTRHFLDSLTALVGLSEDQRGRSLHAVDVGSGAGLPGLALALALPHWQVTLIDSVGKKTAFLHHVCAVLGVEARVSVVTARAEDAAHDANHRAAYDLALARAVASVATLAEYLLPLCRVGGTMLALKKGDIGAEVALAATAVRLLGGAPLRVEVVPDLADLGADRAAVISTKLRPTPAPYPRRAGLPAKEPLR